MKVPADYKYSNVCIIGLGYVGLTLAVVMAEAGFSVAAVEKNASIVEVVNNGKAHFHENGLDGRLLSQSAKGTIRAYNSFEDLPDSSVYIITVGTPLLAGSKQTNLDAIVAVARAVSARLKHDDVVVLRSTVKIGVSRDIVKPILDEAGVKYHLAFCPERTLEGKALTELVSLPQIVGGFDDDSSLQTGQIFGFLTPTIIRVSSLEAAEMVKLVNNTQRDISFAFANEVAGYCDSVGISADEVIKSANMGYTRSSLAMPGPVGGPCLEKDPYILAEGIKSREGVADLALLGRKINERLTRNTAEYLSKLCTTRDLGTQGLKVSIVGLAFKGRPETSDLRGTLAIPLIADLRECMANVTVFGYDPACDKKELASLSIQIADKIEDAFDKAHIVIFQNNNMLFSKVDLNTLSKSMINYGIIYDLWAQFDMQSIDLSNQVSYGGLGLHYRFN